MEPKRTSYVIFHNLDAGYMRIYQRGDRLADGYRGTIRTSGDLARAAEAVFSRHNRDDRPDGQSAPSLSVGDVVVFGEVALSVDGRGFAPVHLDPDDLLQCTWLDTDRM
jgi:hypothetical protein